MLDGAETAPSSWLKMFLNRNCEGVSMYALLEFSMQNLPFVGQLV